jgi:hypothetical protein
VRLAPALAVLLAALPTAAPSRSKGERASAKPAPSAGRPLDDQRAAVAQELARVGAALQAEIEAGNVDALAARIPREGLRCGERVLPRDRVLRDLRGPDTWLHGVLFGAPGEAARRGEPTSLRAFLSGAKEVAVLVAFARDARAGPAGRPCLDFRAKDLVNPARSFCFEEQGGTWWLTQSLYPCGPLE